MRAYPAWTAGTSRSETALMIAVPGLLVKSGAEGVSGFALADGRAGAVKIDDGSERAVPPLVVALLAALTAARPDGSARPEAGAGPVPGTDLTALNALAVPPVTGGDDTVGAIRAVWPS